MQQNKKTPVRPCVSCTFVRRKCTHSRNYSTCRTQIPVGGEDVLAAGTEDATPTKEMQENAPILGVRVTAKGWRALKRLVDSHAINEGCKWL